MKLRKGLLTIIAVIVIMSITAGIVLADDGDLFRRNISKTPDAETEKAAIYMMDFYVPAQASTGLVGPVDNYLLADELTSGYEARDYAKPLVSVYIDDLVGSQNSLLGGVSFGEYDAFVGVSLDDGTSWKTSNLSRSAHLSSFTLKSGRAYPGDVHHVVHQVAEDKILAVWASKYCKSGFPLYSLDPVEEADYLGDLETTYGKNALYLYDFFGVAGNQGSVNYTEQGFPEIGEIPYSCIWTARGKLIAGDDPLTADAQEATHVVWTKPERLTSGVRDANLPAVDCAKNAGCSLTWQEDPEGLRPGKGLGPGEGWSGAIANAKTDIWYSYITFADFDLVVSEDTDPATPATAMLIEDYEAAMGTAMDMPKPYVPMAMPVRLTDNDMCRATAGLKNPEDPFCWINFDDQEFLDLDHTTVTGFLDGLDGPMENANFCASEVSWTNNGGTDLPICVTRDGRWMIGRVGATRVRMVIKPYTPAEAVDLDGDGVVESSAWLSLGAEETKALGTTGDLDGDGDAELDPVDIGKDMFYYSFDYAKPYNLHVNPAQDVEDPSPYVVQQGGMINQPAKCSEWFETSENINPAITCPAHGEFFDTLIDEDTDYEYYLTEISRRFAMTLNNIPNITNTEINQSGLAGMLIYKQGIIWQGGPADIMLRRLVIPEDFDVQVDNPFAYENMDCTNPDGTSGWVYPEDATWGTNPNYLKGLCMAPAINISGTTIKTCTTGTGNDACAQTFPVAEDGTIPVEIDKFPKVLEWRQCDGISAIDGCEGDNDIDDQTWESPFDVAKGHRGFLYGDMVMMMYAWSPNWQSNAVGNDHYNLYQRRSFDGGLTWTTTPSGLGGAGLDALEFYYGETIGDFVPYLWQYGAGDFEQARNLSLLHGNKVTILDPRYSPPGGLKQYATIRTDWLTEKGFSFEGLPYEDDAAIDPSKYYMVYETGDNTTVAVGEAIPLDLFYSRATVYGDTFEWYDYPTDDLDGNPEPGEPLAMSVDIEPRFPWLENQSAILSGEASVVMNPGGTFVYNVWNQWEEEILPDGHELIFNSDILFRRLLWLTDDDERAFISTEPIVYFTYTGTTTIYDHSMEIILVAAARDLDKLGEGEDIVEFEWTVDGNKADVTGKVFKAPARTLSNGWHGFSVRAKDNEGHWSKPKTINLQVVESLVIPPDDKTNFKIFLPVNMVK